MALLFLGPLGSIPGQEAGEAIVEVLDSDLSKVAVYHRSFRSIKWKDFRPLEWIICMDKALNIGLMLWLFLSLLKDGLDGTDTDGHNLQNNNEPQKGSRESHFKRAGIIYCSLV